MFATASSSVVGVCCFFLLEGTTWRRLCAGGKKEHAKRKAKKDKQYRTHALNEMLKIDRTEHRGLQLTTCEQIFMYMARLLSHRWVLLVVLVVVGLYTIGRCLRRLAESKHTGYTTLYDPNTLEETIRQFAETPVVAGTVSERHRTESLCRTLLEQMMGIKLPKVRPKWLLNPTTRRSLELDMYCEDLKLAFEFDGSQHDTYAPHYHKNEDHFRYRQLLDRLKTQLCEEAGVLLIRIPWHQVSLSDHAKTAQYLETLLRTHHIPFRSLMPTKAASRSRSRSSPGEAV